jgi:hypothetical protein
VRLIASAFARRGMGRRERALFDHLSLASQVGGGPARGAREAGGDWGGGKMGGGRGDGFVLGKMVRVMRRGESLGSRQDVFKEAGCERRLGVRGGWV